MKTRKGFDWLRFMWVAMIANAFVAGTVLCSPGFIFAPLFP